MSAPLSYLSADGPAAGPIVQLAWGLGAIALAVVVLVGIALVWAIYRRRPAQADLRAIGGLGAGLSWIYIGLGVSVFVLAACTVWTLVVLARVMHAEREPHLTIQVTAHQWWWEARYLNAAGEVFTTANEIHIPAGEPVRVELASHDVIHSFWVPRLAGKMDLIPGLTNVAWIEAASPGQFRGQCAEYCGLQHAHMAFIVIAQPSADFSAWAEHQLAPPQPGDGEVLAGGAVFAARCAGCHTIGGTPAGGIVGPDLSHLAGRSTLAAGTIPNDDGALTAWIENPQAVKPGARMPRIALSATEQSQVVAYLRSLT